MRLITFAAPIAAPVAAMALGAVVLSGCGRDKDILADNTYSVPSENDSATREVPAPPASTYPSAPLSGSPSTVMPGPGAPVSPNPSIPPARPDPNDPNATLPPGSPPTPLPN